jgi:hypothetical protein
MPSKARKLAKRPKEEPFHLLIWISFGAYGGSWAIRTTRHVVVDDNNKVAVSKIGNYYKIEFQENGGATLRKQVCLSRLKNALWLWTLFDCDEYVGEKAEKATFLNPTYTICLQCSILRKMEL